MEDKTLSGKKYHSLLNFICTEIVQQEYFYLKTHEKSFTKGHQIIDRLLSHTLRIGLKFVLTLTTVQYIALCPI